MKILCCEYATGGGGFEDESLISPDSNFLREGAAMLRAVVADLQRVPHVTVRVFRDRRLPQLAWPRCEIVDVAAAGELDRLLATESTAVSGVFLIAPECGGVLERCSRVVTLAGGELLTPSGEFLRLGSDKNAAAACWEAAGVPTAIGVPLTAGELLPANFSYPAVLKPADGAGSAGVRLVPSWAPGLVVPNDSPRWRLEQHMPGRAASVLMLARDGQRVCFPPSWQHLSDDGRFTYQGGSTPIPAALAIRAETLAHAAAAALPPTNGLFGFDLVLNDAWPGDVVIEVNPRLTTSYLGVRRLVVDNPLAALLSRRVPAAWRVAPDVTARAPIVFAADDIFAA